MAVFVAREHGPATADCGCAIAAATVPRRHFLRLGLATAASLAAPIALVPGPANAAGGNYEAMLLTCIDPRFLEAARSFMAGRHWIGKYSQFVFAGAGIGAVAPRFDSWHQTFWDNLQITIELHNIKSVVALDHRDCGAAKLAYGDDAVATPKAETETHRKALAEFREEVGRRHPKLNVVTGLIGRDHKVQMIG